MNTMLRSVLREHADTTPAPRVDLDSIVSTGNRRVRRARLSTGLGAMAVTGVIAAGVTVLPGVLPGSPPPEGQAAGSAPAFSERQAGFAEGQVIHWGQERYDVGVEVASYVQTDDGFVHAARDGRVLLFDGTVSVEIGTVEDGRLRADDSGSLVAWTDRGEDDGLDVVVYDTAARAEAARLDAPAGGSDSTPSLVALDDGSVYVTTGAALTRHDVVSGEEEVLAAYAGPSDPATKADGGLPQLVDVADGTLAFTRDVADRTRMYVGPSVDDAAEMPTGWHGTLSPSGSHLGVEEADESAVYRVDGAGDVTPDLTGYAFSAVYGWSDDGTALVLAIADLSGGGPGYDTDFLRCSVGTGECAVVTTAELDERAVLPVGDPAS